MITDSSFNYERFGNLFRLKRVLAADNLSSELNHACFLLLVKPWRYLIPGNKILPQKKYSEPRDSPKRGNGCMNSFSILSNSDDSIEIKALRGFSVGIIFHFEVIIVEPLN